MCRVKLLVLSAIALFCLVAKSSNNQFVGRMEPVPESIKKQMVGISWHEGCPISLEQMSYLTVSYWGMDGSVHIGHIVMMKPIAGEVLQIFSELFDHKFPIEKMDLPYHFKSMNDEASMAANNTAGFFCREDGQSPGKYSPHSYGIAIDINPVQNPAQISKHKISPLAGSQYIDRSQPSKNVPGAIYANEKVVQIFASHGWKWGGYWERDKIDYMHFQKDMDSHYRCDHLVLNPLNR